MSNYYGHKTYVDEDGNRTHVGLTRKEAEEIWAEHEVNERINAGGREVPSPQAAAFIISRVSRELEQMGWRRPPNWVSEEFSDRVEAMIEVGCTRVIEGDRVSVNRKKDGSLSFWIAEAGDLWPSRPLYVKWAPSEEG